MTAICRTMPMATIPRSRRSPSSLAGERLVTVRYHEPRAFRTFSARVQKAVSGCETGLGVLVALLETIVDRLPTFLSGPAATSTGCPGRFSGAAAPSLAQARDFQKVLEEIGPGGDQTSNLRDSLVTFERMAEGWAAV